MFEEFNSGIMMPTQSNQYKLHDDLPKGYYIIDADMTGKLYFKPHPEFEHIPKYYGRTKEYAQRIINTYKDRPNNTGVLLSGEKGTGKTLLARYVALEMNCPVIIINQAFAINELIVLFSYVKKNCVIIFDEFEKTYGAWENSKKGSDQDTLLSILDGLTRSKKLFIFITNSYTSISYYMKNRPGRIFYDIKFDTVDDLFIKEYCMDNLKEKKHIPQIIKMSKLFNKFNFDCLKALVEEMNRYKETAVQAISMLNISMDNIGYIKYDYVLTSGTKKIKKGQFSGNLFDEISIETYATKGGYKTYTFSPANFAGNSGDTFVFKKGLNKIELTKYIEKPLNLDKLTKKELEE